MFNRIPENGLLDVLEENGIGSIAFCPLAQGLLTNKYLNGIPSDSRAADSNSIFLNSDSVTKEKVEKVRKLNEIALNRNQSMAGLALAWVLRGGRITTALIGASKTSQIIENVSVLQNLDFTEEELAAIELILSN